MKNFITNLRFCLENENVFLFFFSVFEILQLSCNKRVNIITFYWYEIVDLNTINPFFDEECVR